MKSEDVRSEANLFVSDANQALVLIEEMRGLLQRHISPDEELRGEFHTLLESVEGRYQVVTDEAAGLGNGEGRQPIEWYVELIANAESHRKELEDALLILQRFISVGSEKALYDNALEPYRIAARQKAAGLPGEDRAVSPSEETAVESSFLEAVALGGDGLEDEDGMRLVNELDNHFSGSVIAGLTRDAFTEGFHPQETLEPTTAADRANAASDDSDAGDIIPTTDQSADEEEQSANEAGRPRREAPIEENGSNDEACDGEHADTITLEDETQKEEADLAEAGQLDTHEFYLPSSAPINPRRVEWKKELPNSAPKSIRTTLPVLAIFECLTEEQLESLTMLLSNSRYNASDAKRAGNYIVRRGLATIYDIEGAKALCTTEFCCDLINRGGIRSLRFGNSPFWELDLPKSSHGFDHQIPVEFAKERIKRISLFLEYVAAVNSSRKTRRRGPVDYQFTLADDNTLEVQLTWEGVKHRCVLLAEDEAAPLNAENIAVVLHGSDSAIQQAEGFAGKTFVLRDGVIRLSENEAGLDGALSDNQEKTTEEPLPGPTTQSESSNAEDKPIQGGDGSNPASVEVEFGGPEHPQTPENQPIIVSVDKSQADSPSEEQADDSDDNPDEQLQNSHGDSPKGMPIAKGDEVESSNVAFPESGMVESDSSSGELDGTESEIDLSHILGSGQRPEDDTLLNLASGILDGSIGVWQSDELDVQCAIATAFASAACVGDDGAGPVNRAYKQLVLATDSLIERHAYDVDSISNAFAAYGSNSNEGLLLATYCHAMFKQEHADDWNLWSMFDMHANGFDEFFPSYPEARRLFELLNSIHVKSHTMGFSKQVVDHLLGDSGRAAALQSVKDRAGKLSEIQRVTGPIKGVTQAVDYVCRMNGPLTKALKSVSSNDAKAVKSVRQLVKRFVGDDVLSPKLDEEALREAVHESWRIAVYDKGISGIRPQELTFKAFDIIKYHIVDRILLLCEWLAMQEADGDEAVFESLRELRLEIIDECERVRSLLSRSANKPGSTVVLVMLKTLEMRLKGEDNNGSPFIDFLRTGLISLDDRLLPIISDNDDRVPYFEPWRRILKHVTKRSISFEEAKSAISDKDSETYTNIRQLGHLCAVIDGKPMPNGTYNSAASDSRKAAENAYKTFKAKLEIWCNYGRIDDEQREDLAGLAEDSKEGLYALEDFGCWRQLLAGLEKRSLDLGKDQLDNLEQRLKSCEERLQEDDDTSLLDAARSLLIEERNYSVVEDYLNWFDAGARRIDDVMPDDKAYVDDFASFMSDEVFQPLYDRCQAAKGSSVRFKSESKRYMREVHGEDWSDDQKSNSDELIMSWPSNRKYNTTQLRNLLLNLGFLVDGKCMSIKGDSEGIEHYRVPLKPESHTRKTYKHPIAKFGTQCVSSVDVVVTYENPSHTTIIDLATKVNATTASIILVDYHMDRQARRQVAEACKGSEDHPNTFLLIDRVLLLYLALAQKSERLPKLLKCTLPFTYCQPFSYDKGLAPDEMFCGRVSELQSITEHGGACFVYGGRQLGKSALLNRAAGLMNNPSARQYAVRVDLRSYSTEEEVVHASREALNKVIVGKKDGKISQCDTLEELCDRIDNLIRRKSIDSLLLLLDEADNFLSGIAKDKYEQLRPLVTLHQDCGSFKFVLAGTHNVARASAATAENGIFGQMGTPLCIRPLPPRDALRLLRRPLLYLGYHIDSPNIETILTKTNYYPGIVQFFGYKLVESMSTHFGTYYTSVSNPPCPLSEGQLAGILADSDISESVKDKFLLSLRRDEHGRYMLLARIVTAIYYDLIRDGLPVSDGISFDRIIDNVRQYGFTKLASETDKSLENLLDEMVAMDIFTKIEKGEKRYYRLRRRSFLGYIGSYDAVWDKLNDEVPS